MKTDGLKLMIFRFTVGDLIDFMLLLSTSLKNKG